jgi:multiple sugar transport system permease protein
MSPTDRGEDRMTDDGAPENETNGEDGTRTDGGATAGARETEGSFGREFRIPYRFRKGAFNAGQYGSALLIALVIGFPLYWMAQNAFKTRLAINEGISFLPLGDAFTLERFGIVLTRDVSTYIINSIIVSVGTVVLVIAVSLVAGYGLARFDFTYKVGFARFLLLGYMFSPIVLALPLYLIWERIGLLNTYIGLILALSAISMPFGVWLMWKYIQTIPVAMEESAWIAGAPRWRGFVDIVLPQTAPAIIANALFSFSLAWGDFTFAKILLPSNAKTTFPPGILRLVQSSFATGPGELMAVGLLMTLPPLLFAFFMQSYLLEGFSIRAL